MADDEKLPIGYPCRNSDILILNEQDRPAQQDELGELCVRGSSLALGYWNNPERTAQAFVQNPLNPHYPELIYRTGDIVHRNQRGEIMIVGRKDFQVKHLGYRIDLGGGGARRAASGRHRQCLRDLRPDKRQITLFFESARELPAAVRSASGWPRICPKYMLPTVFQRVEQLPRNPNGKIDRQLLAGRAPIPAAERGRHEDARPSAQRDPPGVRFCRLAGFPRRRHARLFRHGDSGGGPRRGSRHLPSRAWTSCRCISEISHTIAALLRKYGVAP